MTSRRILGAGALSAILFWVADAALDAWTFSPGSFLDLLIRDIPPHDLIFRLVVAALCLSAAFLVSRMAERRGEAREEAQLIDAAIDGFLVVDLDGRIRLGNEAISELLGYTLEEMREFHIWELDALDSEEAAADRMAAIRQAGSVRFETQHRTKDGSVVEVEVSARYIPSGSPRIIAFVRDIRERRRAERALRES